MKQHIVVLVALVALGGLLAVGCTQAQPAPSAPSAPAAGAAAQVGQPTYAPAPTKAPVAPAAVPTAVPKVDYPQKGKTITILVTAPAGGGVDIVARLLAAGLEKELGVAVAVTNKGDAGGQAGATEVVNSKPDGYTIGATGVPSNNTIYLNPDRKATFGRKDFIPLATHVLDPAGIAVRSDSPFKSLKDLMDAAKANPEKITMSANGVMTGTHLGTLQFERATGVKFASVMIAGDAPAATALVGGHVQASFAWSGPLVPLFKNGDVRLLAIADKQRSPFYPDVPTMTESGINITSITARGYFLPAGTPKEIVDILATAAKKVIEEPGNKKKMDETGSAVRFMGPAEFGTYWDSIDAQYGPLIKELAAAQKK